MTTVISFIKNEKLSLLFRKQVVVSNTSPNQTNSIAKLLKDPPIGQTKHLIWLLTPVGIAALPKSSVSTELPPYDEAIKEGLEIALDLSREEREFHQTEKGLVLLFYS